MGAAALTCQFPSERFKPQWSYRTPEGYRDDFYLIPFGFAVLADGSLHLGLPWQLDDDAPFLLRGIIFPLIGTANPAYNQIPPVGFPGLCRIWDSFGNQLSEGLVLALGVWGQSGFTSTDTPTGINAFGFPVEPEVICAPGGTLLFDFQLQTDATAAFLVDPGNVVIYVARIYGTAGNGYTITIVNPGAPNVPLSVGVIGTAVTVTLATNGASAIITTVLELATAINSDPAASALIGVVSIAAPSAIAAALATTPLAGGAAATGSPIPLTGTLIGVKRFKEC